MYKYDNRASEASVEKFSSRDSLYNDSLRKIKPSLSQGFPIFNKQFINSKRGYPANPAKILSTITCANFSLL